MTLRFSRYQVQLGNACQIRQAELVTHSLPSWTW